MLSSNHTHKCYSGDAGVDGVNLIVKDMGLHDTSSSMRLEEKERKAKDCPWTFCDLEVSKGQRKDQ
jgi:hypothetical protein